MDGNVLAVLAAMLGSLVRYRRRVGHRAIRPAGTTAEAAWMVVPITIVFLMVVLAFRVHDRFGTAGEVDAAVKATSSETSAASRDE